jgi:hypothetical protein
LDIFLQSYQEYACLSKNLHQNRILHVILHQKRILHFCAAYYSHADSIYLHDFVAGTTCGCTCGSNSIVLYLPTLQTAFPHSSMHIQKVSLVLFHSTSINTHSYHPIAPATVRCIAGSRSLLKARISSFRLSNLSVH